MKLPAFALTSCTGFVFSLLVICGAIARAQTTEQPTRFEYDAGGNLTKIVDPLGSTTTQSYDLLDRLSRKTFPAPAPAGQRPVIGFEYDGLDQLVKVTDPRNLITSYSVDGLGNQNTLTSPDTLKTVQTFDGLGNLKTSKDARALITSYSYDSLNRVTGAVYATGVPTTFEYDTGSSGAIGQLSRMTDESGGTTYSYDAAGRLLTKAQTVTNSGVTRIFSLTHAYGNSGNGLGQLASMTYPSGNRLLIEYDAAGRISSLAIVRAGGASQVPLLTNLRYTPFGGVQSWIWGSSNSSAPKIYERQFDLNGRLTSYPLGSTIKRTLTYDGAGRIVKTEHTSAGKPAGPVPYMNQIFGYDSLDRLTSFIADTTAQSFTYDANGNRTGARLGAQLYPYTVDALSNRLLRAAGPLPIKVNVYDPAGNLLGDGTTTFGYSARGRMQTARTSAGTVVYRYNGLGQRVLKTGPAALVPTGASYFLYDQQNLIGEYDANGGVIEETVYLGDTPVSVIKPAPGPVSTNAGVFYAYADHLDTVRMIARAIDDRIVWRWEGADPFGMSPANENPSALGAFVYNQRFPGHYLDKETNLFYNYFRDYDPQTGRYIQSDPIGLQGGINSYTYGLGNPISFIDPTGLDATDWNKTQGGRSRWDGPTNGNWGGKCWSGGRYSCRGQPSGNAPPTDSGDQCYQHHDSCYDTCGAIAQCIAACDRTLVDELDALPADPRRWPQPPRPGTEADSRRYRDAARRYFH